MARSLAFAALTLGLVVSLAGAPAAAAAAKRHALPDGRAGQRGAQAGRAIAKPSEAAPVSGPARAVADWVSASGDNGGLPFMVIDKLAARVFVFESDGTLRGASPALLGLARGDGSVPGIGKRKLSAIRPSERTTPAGRFVAAYGVGYGMQHVLWIDYATAISIHPVVTSNPKEQRLRRLKSPTVKDNRITFGCINVAAGFYEDVVRRTFTGTRGVVYILPETEPLEAVFPAVGLRQARAAASSEPQPVAAPAPQGEVARSSDAAGSDTVQVGPAAGAGRPQAEEPSAVAAR